MHLQRGLHHAFRGDGRGTATRGAVLRQHSARMSQRFRKTDEEFLPGGIEPDAAQSRERGQGKQRRSQGGLQQALQARRAIPLAPARPHQDSDGCRGHREIHFFECEQAPTGSQRTAWMPQDGSQLRCVRRREPQLC